jgi:DNA repair protein RAD50
MSEPSVLKKKFDEIFEALKYTKAIDNIKTVRKAQAGELTKHKLLEDQYKIEKDRGERAEKQSMKLQTEIENLRAEGERLTREIEEAVELAREKNKAALEYDGILKELNLKRSQADDRQQNLDELKENLEELSESDEWLENTLAQYEDTMSRFRAEERDYQERYAELQRSREQSRQRLDDMLADQGQYQAEKESYERQIAARQSLIKEAARKHEIRGFDGTLDDSKVRSFIERMMRLVQEKSRELERIRQSTDDEFKDAQAKLAELQGRRSAKMQDKLSAKQDETANDRKIGAIKEEVDSIRTDEGAKAVLDLSHQDLRNRLDKATQDYDGSNWDAQLQLATSKLRDLEEEASQLNDYLVQSTRMAKDRAAFDFTKGELKDRQQSLNTMVATYREKIEDLIETQIAPETLERDFHLVLEQKSSVLKDAITQRDVTSQELQQVTFKLETAESSRKKKVEEAKRCESVVLGSILDEETGKPLTAIEDFLPELRQLESDLETVKSDIENFSHLDKFWQGCIGAAERKNLCHVCERPFSGEAEKSTVLSKLRARLKKDTLERLKADLKDIEDTVREPQTVRPQYDTYIRLTESEIPVLDKEISELQSQRDALLQQQEHQVDLVRQAENSKMDAEELTKPTSTIARYQAEILGFENDVNRLSSQQKTAGVPFSLEEIQEKQGVCSEEMRIAKSNINKLSSEKERGRALINTLELELRDTATKMVNADHQMEKKQALLGRIQELRDSNKLRREAVLRADADLEALVPEIENAKAQCEDIKQRGRMKESKVNEELLKLSDTSTKLHNADEVIKNYLDAGGPERLNNCLRSIKSVEKDMTAN